MSQIHHADEMGQGERMRGHGPTRRGWMTSAAAATLAAVSPWGRLRGGANPALAADPAEPLTLSIGTYSLKGLSLEESVGTVASIGYDGLEIAVQPGFEGEPSRFSPERRKRIRSLLRERGLRLTALMEQITPNADARKHEADLDRLRQVFELSRELDPKSPPLVQTVLGGGTWDERKSLYLDRVGAWADLAKDAQVTLAIKPHRGGAMSRPSEAIWLIRELGNPARLRMVYDYSHYAFREMTLADTVRESLPYMAHVAVKDAVQDGDKVKFLLPGAGGQFDYATLLQLLVEGGYRGDICCEVSSMVSRDAKYDPIAAAKTCYANLAAAFDRAKVARPKSVEKG